jgi:putative ABC transport system permease protein
MLRDFKYALRVLAKNPGFSLFAVFSLALGIGANSAIFSVVNGVLLKPLHYQRPDELVWIWSTRKDVSRAFFSIPNFQDTREQNRTIETFLGIGTFGVNLTGSGETERLQGARISADTFRTLGVEAESGRTLQLADEKASAERVAMLSHGLWQRRFGGDPGVIGRTLTLNGDSYTVVGILPRDFVIPNLETEIVTPLRLDSDPRRAERGSNFLRVIGRLKPGVTAAQAQQDLAAITDRLRQQYPEDNGNLTAPRVVPLHDELTGGYRQALIVLLGAVALVLLIACSNLANLQLARAAARRREIAIRSALGATRWHITRQVLAEGILLGLAGGTLGLLGAIWGKDFLLQLAPSDFPLASSVTVNTPVLFFCVGISLFAGVVLGLVPALQTLRTEPSEDLKDGAWSDAGGRGRSRARHVLIVAEIALSLVLLVAAGLVIKSFARLRAVDPGFTVEHALAVRLSLPASKYRTGEAVEILYDKLAPHLAAIPGVESVVATSALPMSGLNARTDFVISGRPPVLPSEIPAAQHRWVSPGFFRAMNIPLRHGREFIEQDNERGAGVVVIDQALSRRFFANQDPLGAHILITMGDNLPPREYEIVGVVENVKHNSLNEEPIPTFYGPIPQAPKSAVPFLANNFSVVVHTKLPAQTVVSAVRAELKSIDTDVAVSSVKPLTQFLAAAVAARKFNLLVLGVFAGSALVLAATGLYAVTAYLVAQRTREIGVRLALGAQRSDVLSLVLGYGLRLVAIGLLIGLAGAFMAARMLSTLLFNTSPADPATYGAVALLLVVVALIASYLPARRAMNVDPITALRAE